MISCSVVGNLKLRLIDTKQKSRFRGINWWFSKLEKYAFVNISQANEILSEDSIFEPVL